MTVNTLSHNNQEGLEGSGATWLCMQESIASTRSNPTWP